MTVERFDVGPAIVLVPAEDVLLLSVPLPIASPRQRLEALPFAIEDRVAQRLADAHAALGSEQAPQTYLAGVVAHERMARWIGLLVDAGLGHAALVPDVLGVPVPPAASWSVDLAADRALVRVGDGTGFALPAAHFVTAWSAAGQPRLLCYGETPPVEGSVEPATYEEDTLAARLTRPALDLRQGAYAAPRTGVTPLWRRIALVAAAGALAHAAIACADTAALRHMASAKAADARALIQQTMPGAAIGDDVAASAADLMPAGGPGSSSFLPLFNRVGGALKPLGSAVTLKSVAYDAGANTMNIEVEAADMNRLQQVGAALAGAGLSAQEGAATQVENRAIGAFLVRGAA